MHIWCVQVHHLPGLFQRYHQSLKDIRRSQTISWHLNSGVKDFWQTEHLQEKWECLPNVPQPQSNRICDWRSWTALHPFPNVFIASVFWKLSRGWFDVVWSSKRSMVLELTLLCAECSPSPGGSQTVCHGTLGNHGELEGVPWGVPNGPY